MKRYFNFLTNREWNYQSLVNDQLFDWLSMKKDEEKDLGFTTLYEFYQQIGTIAYRARKQGQSGYKTAIDQIIELVDKVE